MKISELKQLIKECVEETVNEGPNPNMIHGETYLMHLPNPRNDAEAMKKLQDLKAVLGDKYIIKLRGRDPDRKGMAQRSGYPHSSLRRSVPLKLNPAEVAVYLYPKK